MTPYDERGENYIQVSIAQQRENDVLGDQYYQPTSVYYAPAPESQDSSHIIPPWTNQYNSHDPSPPPPEPEPTPEPTPGPTPDPDPTPEPTPTPSQNSTVPTNGTDDSSSTNAAGTIPSSTSEFIKDNMMKIIIAGSALIFLIITIITCCCCCKKGKKEDPYMYKTYSVQHSDGDPIALDQEGLI